MYGLLATKCLKALEDSSPATSSFFVILTEVA